MPISPEKKDRYPKDWKLRSRFIREFRANNKCEWCGVPNHAVGWRDEKGKFHGARGNIKIDFAGNGLQYPDFFIIPYKESKAIADNLNECEVLNDFKYIVIVLTVAHVFDHRPEAASFLNLAALCQKCHNDHDSKMRRNNAKKRKEKNQIRLF
jgi:hypothetical protein